MTELSESQRAWFRRHDDALDVEDPRAGALLHAVVDHLEKKQDRKRGFLLLGAMYAGAGQGRGMTRSVDMYSRGIASDNNQLALNVTRNVVDAVVSRVFAKSEPHLTYVTEGGGPHKQKNAKELERGVEGTFYNAGATDKFTTMGRDGSVYGTGFVRVEADHEFRRVKLSRYRPWEVTFDDGETVYGDEPRSLYTARYIDKFVLLHQVKTGILNREDSTEECATKAELVSRLSEDTAAKLELGYQQVALRVRIEEAWHRPSGKDAKDGRHVIACGAQGEVTIVDEMWDGGPLGRPWDFAEYRWSKPIEGFYGQGIVELGMDLQFQINKIVREIAKGMHLITGFWAVEAGSKVVKAHIQNELSNILTYQGQAPQRIVPGIIAPEVYAHLIWLVGKYYELASVNQQTAQAQKPAGLDSGEAQRVYADQQTETLVDKGKRFAESIKYAGQLVTDKARELAKEGSYEVRAMADDGFETIDWKSVDDPDGYELRVHDTSALPGTPAGKLALANDMKNIGGFDTADLMELVGMPDIVQSTSLKLASRKLVEKQIADMLETGEPVQPNPFINVPEALQLVAAYYCQAEKKGTEDIPYLDCLRNYAVALTQIKALAVPPPSAPPQAIGPGGGLLGPGVAAPIAPGAPPPLAAPPHAA